MKPSRNRSFVRRQGRMTKAQQSALSKYWSRYGLSIADGPLNLTGTFNRQSSCTLEIGFGMGNTLLTQAIQQPLTNFIGIEVHRPGIGALLAGIAQHQLQNIRLYAEDAVDVLQQCIADHCLARIHIFFPDPWPKRSHHKRRLIQADFVDLLAQKLKQQGILHLATDWQDYAQQMIRCIEKNGCFNNLAGIGQYSDRPLARPRTKFETRGLKLGHDVWDLLFRRQP